ncbi:hypothetical protein M3193_16310 [Sporosarcina luteola]|uniref:hypothetical protein n=1 Tax=Sporosarcina luteola TaxID=582850 RepID=UPI00203D04CF|nr:hypothetical protein [Sporosarcina luteola]MCM3745692.1 hypothetical protein [Sporosarcina luteola]
MKRGTAIAFAIVTVLAILFAYQYQKPILTTDEAIVQAYEYLLDPPEKYGDDLIPTKDLEEMWPINTRLMMKHGFYAEMVNRRAWEVTFRYDGKEPMVILDAITGEFIMIYGPMN